MVSEERINLSNEPPVTPLHANNDSELSSRGVPEEALTHEYDQRVPLGERPNPDNIGTQMNRRPLMDIGGVRGFLKQNRTPAMALGAGLLALGTTLWLSRSRRYVRQPSLWENMMASRSRPQRTWLGLVRR